MALKNTIKSVHELLDHIKHDLTRAEKGNKAAAQRVRTGTIKLAKVAKVYRKESIVDEKKRIKARPAKPKKKAAKGKSRR